MLLLLASLATPAHAQALDRLVRAYPDALVGHDGDVLIWRDGTRMPVSDGRPDKPLAEALHDGTVLDQLRLVYAAGPFRSGFVPENDAGRVRNRAFFDKMYGDCHRGEVEPHLVRVVWLPHSWGHTVSVTSVNGVATQLEAVSREIDDLPDGTRHSAYPSAGAYLCRNVADTHEPSMHAYGAAIDLNVAQSNYWLWQRGGGPVPAYVNRIPPEIVTIFEKHGFIWGGKWTHFDTMHFEYRPELLGAEPE